MAILVTGVGALFAELIHAIIQVRSLLDGSGPKPRVRVLIRHRRGETGTQRRSPAETEAETGGRRPPAQGRTPGAPRSWKRWGGPSSEISRQNRSWGHLDLRRLVPRTGRRWIPIVLVCPAYGHL